MLLKIHIHLRGVSTKVSIGRLSQRSIEVSLKQKCLWIKYTRYIRYSLHEDFVPSGPCNTHIRLLSVSHTRIRSKLQPMYDPKFWHSYLNRRNSAQLVREVVDNPTSKIGLSKVFEHVQNFSSAILTLVANRSYHQSFMVVPPVVNERL